MLPNYCCNIANVYDIKIGGVNTLVPNLDNKSKCFSLSKSSAVFIAGMKLVFMEF